MLHSYVKRVRLPGKPKDDTKLRGGTRKKRNSLDIEATGLVLYAGTVKPKARDARFSVYARHSPGDVCRSLHLGLWSCWADCFCGNSSRSLEPSTY